MFTSSWPRGAALPLDILPRSAPRVHLRRLVLRPLCRPAPRACAPTVDRCVPISSARLPRTLPLCPPIDLLRPADPADSGFKELVNIYYPQH